MSREFTIATAIKHKPNSSDYRQHGDEIMITHILVEISKLMICVCDIELNCNELDGGVISKFRNRSVSLARLN